MSETTARAAIMTAMAQAVADHTSYTLAVESDNRKTIDQVLQTNPYVRIDIDFLGAEQADLAAQPLVRQTGQIVVCAVVKEGSGTAAGSALRDFLRPYFSRKNLGNVRCSVAEIHRAQTLAGWEYMPLLINFWYHEIDV